MMSIKVNGPIHLPVYKIPMLRDYKGPSNSSEIFQHMVGEKVAACFQYERRVWLVTESGHAFVVGGSGDATTVFWQEMPEKVQRVIAERRRDIHQRIRELDDMAGIELVPEQLQLRLVE